MNIKIENNLDENKMVVTVSLEKRKTVSEPRIRVKWWDVERHVQENYTPPNTHVLGDCTGKFRVADNDSDKHLVKEWVFDLLPKKASVKKASVKKASVKKTAAKKTATKKPAAKELSEKKPPEAK